MRQFCTYFDHTYVARGIALIRSLARHSSEFRISVLCLDDVCYETLRAIGMSNVDTISLRELEAVDPLLLDAKANRSRPEYYFTCTPSLLLHMLGRTSERETVTYLDADTWFFADPTPLLDELHHGSVAIVAHRFPPRLKDRNQYGIYNVGWLTFRRDENGLKAASWWRERCIEWCYRRVEPGRYADQKYLDDWPTRFNGVTVLQHKGANVAPWNVESYSVRSVNSTLLVDEQRLIFFHYSGLRQLLGPLYDLGLNAYGVRPSREVLKQIYSPYLRELIDIGRELQEVSVRPPRAAGTRQNYRVLARPWKAVNRLATVPSSLLTGRDVLVIRNKVIGLS
jgi:hypothetical protein